MNDRGLVDEYKEINWVCERVVCGVWVLFEVCVCCRFSGGIIIIVNGMFFVLFLCNI